tara:strand:+ start:23 stop:415 length:393 start_codon:yes stop_codon:yes gene_type:complete
MVLTCVDFNYGDWDVPAESWIGKGRTDAHVLKHVKRYLTEMSEIGLRKFLRFATGSSALPSRATSSVLGRPGENATSSMLRFQRMKKSGRLPEAHTCFNMVELPAYGDYATLKKKMDLAIHGVEDGIGLE